MTLALWISIAGVALGVTQLIVVLSVFSGFQKLLKDNYTRITSELVVVPSRHQLRKDNFREQLLQVEGVEAVTPFMLGQGMVLKKGVAGVTLEGIELSSAKEVTEWKGVWQEKMEDEGQWIWIGSQLAKKHKIQLGETVPVMIADGKMKRIIPFRVTGITKFGIYDHDLRYARIAIGSLREFFKKEDAESLYKIKLKEKAEVSDVMDRLREEFGLRVTLKPWYSIHQNIFLAVQHQKKLLFLVLEIVVALASINVVSLLLMNAQSKRRDIAILRAMGLRVREVLVFFIAQGATIGLFGIGLGMGLGLLACRAIQRWQPSMLNESIYNVSRLPIQIDWVDLVLVVVVAFFLCTVFSVLPAFRAAFQRPVKALRYE